MMTSDDTDKISVFVYGTLLGGERNHHLLASARLVRRAKTPQAYELRDLGRFPALVRRGQYAVAGEVYEVDATTLAALDRLEGHPGMYRRVRISLADGTRVSAYLLRRKQVDGFPIITTGNWRTRRPRSNP